MLGKPFSGRIFFGQVIADNPTSAFNQVSLWAAFARAEAGWTNRSARCCGVVDTTTETKGKPALPAPRIKACADHLVRRGSSGTAGKAKLSADRRQCALR